eukprot:gene11818-13714_t
MSARNDSSSKINKAVEEVMSYKSRTGENDQGTNCIVDLLDHSDAEEVAPMGHNTQALDSEILRLYGGLSDYSDEQKCNAFSKTVERIPVYNIYLGIYRYGCPSDANSRNNTHSVNRDLYLRVNSCNNTCLLLSFNADMSDERIAESCSGVGGTKHVEIEEIPFHQIKKIICGPIRANSSQAFLALSVTANLSLNCVHVGPNCMLCPTLTQSTKESGKYVLIMLSTKNLEQFDNQLRAASYVAQKKNINEWLIYRPHWLSCEIKDFLFAHNSRFDHSIEQLRERAKLELKDKHNRLFRKRSANTAVSPTASTTSSTTTIRAYDATAAAYNNFRLLPKKARQEPTVLNALDYSDVNRTSTASMSTPRTTSTNTTLANRDNDADMQNGTTSSTSRSTSKHSNSESIRHAILPTASNDAMNPSVVTTHLPATPVVPHPPRATTTAPHAIVPLETKIEILKFLTQHGDETNKKEAMRELMALAKQQ